MAGIPTTVRALSATSQSAPAGSAVGEPPSVIVEDVDGFPVPGFTVTLAVTGGGGSVSPASLQTDINGIATATQWILGATPGANTATATASGLAGSPKQFSATGTEPPAATIVPNSTQSQSATVGTAVAAPPSVLVKDTLGAPKAGVTVLASVLSGGGQISGTSLVTNGSGIATLGSWTLGTTAGAQSVQLSVGGLAGDPVVFSATATAGAATAMVAVSSVNQTGQISTPVGSPPAVRVQDTFGNPKAGVSVLFGVTGGGGSVNPVTAVVSGADGVSALTSWTLGGSAGANSVTATSAGIPSVVFDATATNPPTTIAAASGTSQTAGTSTNVADPPAVLVTGAGGVPVEGVLVTFAVTAGGGSVSPATVLTGPDGIARTARWTVGATPGANTVTATKAGLAGNPVTFSATGAALTATSMQAASATTQQVAVSTNVSDRPAVRVKDASGLVVAGVAVNFAVTAGGGSITPASVNTDADGLARATNWTAGATVGVDVNQATATVAGLAGSPQLFRASGVPGPATSLAAQSPLSQSAPIGTPVATPPAVRVTDSAGNPVPNHPVVFTRGQDDGSISPAAPATVPTGPDGVAALTRWTLGSEVGVGTSQVIATASGLGGSPVVFSGTGVAGGSAPVSPVARAPFERIDIATDMVCLGGVVVATVASLVSARVNHRFDGIVRLASVTFSFARDGWEQQAELIAHRVARVVRQDGDFDEYRISDIVDSSGGDGIVTVETTDPILDLAQRGRFVSLVTAGATSLTVEVIGRTIAAMMVETILPAGPPGEFAVGITQPGTFSVSVTKASPFAALVAGVTALNTATLSEHEISARRNGTTNYLIDIATVGAAAPPQDVRAGKNLIGMERTRSSLEQATRLLPTDGAGRTLRDNAWVVVAVNAGVSIDVASITGGIGPSTEAGQLAGMGWIDATGTVHPITGSVVLSGEVTRLLMASTTGITAGNWGSLAADSSGADVVLVESPALQSAFGIVAKELPSEIPNVTNLIRNPDLALWPGGTLPTGWSAIGTPPALDLTVHRSGGRSAKVTSNSGMLQTNPVRLKGAGTLTYVVWVRIQTFPNPFTDAEIRVRGPSGLIVLNLPSVLNTWLPVVQSFPISGPTNLTVELQIQQVVTNTGGVWWFDGAMVLMDDTTTDPILVGSGAAQNWQRALRRFQTHGAPVPTYRVNLADLTSHDPGAWPDDQLHHGGVVDVTDEELGSFSQRLVANVEDLIEPLKSQPTLATQPRLLSTLLRSVV